MTNKNDHQNQNGSNSNSQENISVEAYESKMISRFKTIRWEIKNFHEIYQAKAETSVKCLFEMGRIGNVPPSKWEFTIFRKGESEFKYDLNWQMRLIVPTNTQVTSRNTVKLLKGHEHHFKVHAPGNCTGLTGVVFSTGNCHHEEMVHNNKTIKDSFTGKLVDETWMKFNSNYIHGGSFKIEFDFGIFGDDGKFI